MPLINKPGIVKIPITPKEECLAGGRTILTLRPNFTVLDGNNNTIPSVFDLNSLGPNSVDDVRGIYVENNHADANGNTGTLLITVQDTGQQTSIPSGVIVALPMWITKRGKLIITCTPSTPGQSAGAPFIELLNFEVMPFYIVPPIAAPAPSGGGTAVVYWVPTTFAAGANTGLWASNVPAPSGATVGPGGTATESSPWVPPTAGAVGYISSSTTSANPGITWIGSSGAAGLLTLNAFADFKLQALVFVAANVRYWIGLTDDTNPNTGFLQSPNPPRNIAAFRFDPSAGDATWQAYCSTDATHHSQVDTGVAVDTSGALHTYEIKHAQGVPGSLDFYIDGTKVATVATNVPALNTNLGFLVYSDSTNGASSGHVGANLFTATLFQ